MRLRRNLIASLLMGVSMLAGMASLSGEEGPYRIGEYFWPTPNDAFLNGGGLAGIAQPTASGTLQSALFGCVRNNGSRFHEGIDLKAIHRDKRSEPIDPIYAFHSGIVRYVNRVAGKSSYGRYVVIEHPDIAPGVVSIYAHLRSVSSSTKTGENVSGGQVIGVMGRSAGGYGIPRSRAHLHFEIGFWLGDDFQSWYDKQPFGSPNDHGSYNGMNIVGLDVWHFLNSLKRKDVVSVKDYLAKQPVDVLVVVPNANFPELLQNNPELMSNVVLPQDFGGWRIGFTWYGLPLRWEALSKAQLEGISKPKIVDTNKAAMDNLSCNKIVRDGHFPGIGSKLNTLIARLFVGE